MPRILLLSAIAARVDGQHIEVTVRDNGTAIPADMPDSVFALFAQLPRSLARSEAGLGIGVTLAKRIVEMHGGTIKAGSTGPNQGTEIGVRLALAEPAARSSANSHPPMPERAMRFVQAILNFHPDSFCN